MKWGKEISGLHFTKVSVLLRHFPVFTNIILFLFNGPLWNSTVTVYAYNTVVI